jgi:hypothetical protein
MMIKTILIALVYFFIGIGIASSCKSDKKNDPGFIVFVLVFWPLVVAIFLLIVVLGFIVMGISDLCKKWRGE